MRLLSHMSDMPLSMVPNDDCDDRYEVLALTVVAALGVATGGDISIDRSISLALCVVLCLFATCDDFWNVKGRFNYCSFRNRCVRLRWDRLLVVVKKCPWVSTLCVFCLLFFYS